MFKNNILFAVYLICVALISCNAGTKERTRLTFVTINDSLYKSNDDYQQSLLSWKNYYEQCINRELFPNAFYLQLQDKMYIGSINNEHERDVNKAIHILDTSNYHTLFNLLAITNSANCSNFINLNSALKKEFLDEVLQALHALTDDKNMEAVLDTEHMKIKIGSLYENTLKTDSIISLLNRTQDSSLIRFKELLLKPENVLLAQTIEAFGFNVELPLKSKLSAIQEKQLKKPVFFTTDSSKNNAIITLVSNNTIRIQINKRYTVLGTFLKLKQD